ncbi:DEGP1 [Symbiodinium pilosum]|uniref:DEGP1 protein n=1 Tax=Symbiodinium pilosum TaxID=2952 RepID=A0A812RW33_SYMPI|nr:DEGP1 [Symbiodinium pilosum]
MDEPERGLLSDYLKAMFPRSPLLAFIDRGRGFLHRLDVPSSGLILVAKSHDAWYQLKVQAACGDIQRDYLALCHGWMSPHRKEINARICWWPNGRRSPGSVEDSGRLSATKLSIIEFCRIGARGLCLLLIRIVTGRMHQIRLHTSHVGHPTVRDAKYSSKETAQEDARWCPDHFLHRYSLAFFDSARKQLHKVLEPLDSGLQEALGKVSILKAGLAGRPAGIMESQSLRRVVPVSADGKILNASSAEPGEDQGECPGRRELVQQVGLANVLAAGAVAPEPARALARSAEERAAAQVFRAATPGVVAVSRGYRQGERKRSGGVEDGLPPSLGSGFVWDATHVVTNYHVVRDLAPGELQIVFLDAVSGMDENELPKREILKGELIGSDPFTDTAVIKVIPPPSGTMTVGMHPLPTGESSALEVGQTVFAIGNPFGLDHSMSRGIISGKSRTLDIGERPIQGCIQTDASINPGNSGGPLLDAGGRVIGVNTAILTASGTSAGVGLAIPVDTVKRNVELILKKGFVSRGFLGITFAPDAIADALNIPGVIVYGIIPNSPAEQAGVRPMLNGTIGDVITSMDAKTIRTGSDVFRLLDKRVPGDVVALGLQRARRDVDGSAIIDQLTFNVTLSAAPRKF